MGKPRALDLFCGAGGATRGMQMAGFHVTGVDIEPQPRYCGDEFVRGDALGSLYGVGVVNPSMFDFIWASPVCKKYTIAGRGERARGRQYPDQIEPVRTMLAAIGVPYVIENVPGSPLRPDIILCGSHFGLPIARHRLFKTSWHAFCLLPVCAHVAELITVCGHGTPSWMRHKRIKLGLHPNASVAMKRDAMEIQWANREELSQAIPPAYANFIARAFLDRRA